MANLLEAQFSVSDAQNCPLYVEGTVFHLSGFGFSVKEEDKAVCLMLTKEITNILLESSDNSLNPVEAFRKHKEFSCEGCTGMIKFVFNEEKEFETPQMRMMAALAEKSQKAKSLGSYDNLAATFSFFKVLDDNSLKEVMKYLTAEQHGPGDVIIKFGQPGRKLYMIVSGKAAVMDAQGNNIAYLDKGEIFGEMSLFTGKPACATVQAVDDVNLLHISGRDLSQLFLKRPFLQMSFSRFMAHRVSEANTFLTESLSRGMTGQLSEMNITEVLQMLNENQKTGAFLLELDHGQRARVVFSEGEIVKVRFGDKTGEQAFYNLLKENEGRFVFDANIPLEEIGMSPLGNFMKLLMDGMRFIDEEEAGEHDSE